MKRPLLVLTAATVALTSFAAGNPDHDANPVPAIGQNAADVRGAGDAGHPRILFIGNSITRHGPRPSIGWTNDFGMAASSIDRDYVHQTAKMVRESFPTASFALSNVAGSLERKFQKGMEIEKDFGWMRGWKPDAVIFFFGANVPKDYDKNPDGGFGKAVEALRNYLDNGGKTKFLISEGFYVRPVLDAEKKAVAERHGDTFVKMGDISARNDVRGRFNHPSDNGMRLIAERFWSELKPVLSAK